MFTKSLNRVLLASGLALTTAIALAPATFSQTMQGSASNQVTGQLNPFASISWPQPNAFGIATQKTTDVVQYVTLSTNVEYDANVPWEIKAQSLNSSKLVNSSGPALAPGDDEIAYQFALGVGSSTGGDTTGTAASTGTYKTLANTAGGGATIMVSGNPGQGELVPKLELTIKGGATVLTAGAYSDTITLFMFTQ
jgi:hypothetical protein